MNNYRKSRSFRFLIQLVVKRQARYLPPALNLILVYFDYNYSLVRTWKFEHLYVKKKKNNMKCHDFYL